MAVHSNRSPSPLSSRPINPNPRNPETNSTIRRSFTGNNKPSLLTNQRRLDPITPANSPSDFARRRSSVVKDCEEKENDEKDCVLKASKLQSPAKGFMAPTISAASKFTPSPRKKVLVERNEPVRTSISFSDGKAMFFSSNVSQDLEPKNEAFSDSNLAGSENKKPVVAVDSHPVSKPCKKVTFSTESVINDPDSRKLESIAPLDADPSLPPYDPKTNYLSPRPQFIRYKPNPRVEILKGKVLDSDELEYSLMAEMFSEGFSDSDEGNDESQMNKEVTASEDMVIGLDEEIEADAHPPSLSLPVSTAPIDEISEEFVGRKPRSMSRLMCFSVVLALLVACVSVSVTRAPSFDESLFMKDLSLSDLSGSLYEQSRAIVASARLGLGSVAASSASLVFKLANELVEGEKRAPVQFMNLSDLQENAWKEAYFLKRVEDVEEDELGTEMEEEEEAYADEELDLDAEIDAFEEEAYAEADSADDYIEKEYGVVAATEETMIQTKMDQSAEISPDSAQLESEYSHDIQIQTDMVSMQMEQSAGFPQNQETEVEAAAIEVEKSQGDINVRASDNADTITSEQITESTPAEGASVVAVAIPCFFAGVVGVAALVYNKRIPSSSSNVVQVEPIVSRHRDTKKPEAIQQEKEYSESWQTQSEMSSGYEVESSERKARKYYSKRESLASSTESPSYGSFTTYERIPVKTNSYGDEEVMTPVRRSSRIRKQVTSS